MMGRGSSMISLNETKRVDQFEQNFHIRILRMKILRNIKEQF